MTTAITPRPMSEILVAQPEPVNKDAKVSPAAPPTDTAPSEPTTLPEKYTGKTVAEVADMHTNAEKELGRVRNELGVQRGLVQSLSQINREPPPAPAVAPQDEVTITGDQLISDPVGSVQAIIQPALEAERKRNDSAAADTILGTEAKALETDFGDYSQTVASEAFQKFATRTPSRQRDFTVAATGSGLDQVRAARRLLEDFTDFQLQLNPPTTDEVPANDLVAAARAVSTEAGQSTASISAKPQIFESEVVALINSDPLRYRSPSYQTELALAIKEGRFVKNT